MADTLSQSLASSATTDPDRVFVACGGSWRTVGEVDEASDRLAAGLSAIGIDRGDRVALIVPNREEMVDIFFACAKLGAVQVPLNYWLKGEFLGYQLADCGATTLITDAAGAEAARDLLAATEIERIVHLDELSGDAGRDAVAFADVTVSATQAWEPEPGRPSDLLAILYTSGTTGMPKGCMIPHGFYFGCARANAIADWVRPDDRLFTAFPLFHMSGQNALTSALVNGASVCFEPEFSASTFLSRAREEHATVLMGVGPMAMALLAQPPDATDAERGFRMAMFVPLPEAQQLAFEARFATPVIAEGYGQTECSPATSSVLGGTRKRSTAGRAVDHIELRVVDDDDREVPVDSVGEIVIRPREPDVVFQGYWNKADATIEAFRNLWHHTGDYGRLDADGYLTFVDRKTDSVRRRGENISSFELEAAIARRPDVAQVAITAVPSSLGEDDLKATIVASPGSTPDAGVLFEYFVEALPYYAIPRYVEVRAALPTNTLGRVMKHVLRAEGVTESTWDFEALGFSVPKERRRGA